MKKNVFVIIAFILIPLLVVFPVFASSNSEQKTIVLEKDTVVDHDYFAAGDQVMVYGTVNGDAYVAGGNVIVDGVINGDLLVAGGTITIKGSVTQDIRAIGGNITVSSDVGRNISVAGGNAIVTDASTVLGSLTAGVGSLEISAPIGKGMMIGAGAATIANTIGGDVTAGVGQLTLSPNAQVNGNLNYFSQEKALIATGATVTGETKQSLPPQPTPKQADPEKILGLLTAFGFAWKMMSAVTLFVLGAFLIRLAPLYTKQLTSVITDTPWKALIVGIVAMIIAPISMLLLLITFVGIPLSFVLLAVYLVCLVFAKTIFAYTVGEKLFSLISKTSRPYIALVLGIFAFEIATVLPFFGFFVWMVAAAMGLGALFVQKEKFYSHLRSNKEI